MVQPAASHITPMRLVVDRILYVLMAKKDMKTLLPIWTEPESNDDNDIRIRLPNLLWWDRCACLWSYRCRRLLLQQHSTA